MKRFRFFAVALVSFCSAASAQSFPARPVAIVVPFSAGGPTGTHARIMAGLVMSTSGPAPDGSECFSSGITTKPR